VRSALDPNEVVPKPLVKVQKVAHGWQEPIPCRSTTTGDRRRILVAGQRDSIDSFFVHAGEATIK
jgi:hypothetical protein